MGLMFGMGGTGDLCLGWVGLGTYVWDGWDWGLITEVGKSVGLMFGMGRTGDL